MIGRTFPIGRFALTAAMDDRVRALSDAPPRDDDSAHPIFAYIGALHGLSLPIGDWSRAMGLGFDHGPVLGSCVMEYPGRLRTGQEYDVLAEVTAITRKPSRRFGQADHAAFVIALAQADSPVSILRFTMITPVVPA